MCVCACVCRGKGVGEGLVGVGRDQRGWGGVGLGEERGFICKGRSVLRSRKATSRCHGQCDRPFSGRCLL